MKLDCHSAAKARRSDETAVEEGVVEAEGQACVRRAQPVQRNPWIRKVQAISE